MNKRLKLSLLMLTVGFCFVLGEISCLFAQVGGTDDEFTLEEITVTAQKRVENQQKVPIAMEVVSGEELSALGKDNVDDILRNIANVFVNTAEDGMRISLRGITDDSIGMDNQHVADSAVAINVDGSFNNMNNAGQNLFDIERVEVLFGPQSTMYGSNAPGGVVNVVTAAPKTNRYEATGTLEYGTYNLLNLQAVFNAPVIRDKVALRLAANKSSQDSYVEKDEESKTTSARLKALWDVYDKLTFTLTGNWSKRNGGGMMGGAVKPFRDQDGYYADGTKVTDPWTEGVVQAGPFGTGGKGNRFDQITKGVSANIDWETFLGTISLVPSYSKSSSEGRGTSTGGGGGGPGGGGPPPMAMTFAGLMAQQAVFPQQTTERVYYQEDSNVQKGAELRMTNAADFTLFQWIFGGTHYESTQSRSTDYELPTYSDTSRDTVTKKSALYANIVYPVWFSDRFRLTLGYRQSWDKNYSTEVGQMSGTSGNFEGTSKPDWKYGFEYDANENLMLYGSFASSFRSPNAMAPAGSKPEELDSYTAGVKSRWFGNILQVNVAAYYYDYANKLCSGFKVLEDITEEYLGDDYMGQYIDGRGNVRAVIEPDGVYPTRDTLDADKDGDKSEIYVFTANEPGAQGYGAFTSKGLDMQATWIITSKDRLNFSLSYLDSEWVDLHFVYNWWMIWPPENYEGVTPVNSPKWSMTASYERNIPLGSIGILTPRIDMQHKTSYTMLWNPGDADEGGYSYQEPYYTWDASASFNHSSGRWSLNAYVKNFTNYAVKKSYMGFTGSQSLRIGDPRTYGASVSVKF